VVLLPVVVVVGPTRPQGNVLQKDYWPLMMMMMLNTSLGVVVMKSQYRRLDAAAAAACGDDGYCWLESSHHLPGDHILELVTMVVAAAEHHAKKKKIRCRCSWCYIDTRN
jgi:hypothetical protein